MRFSAQNVAYAPASAADGVLWRCMQCSQLASCVAEHRRRCKGALSSAAPKPCLCAAKCLIHESRCEHRVARSMQPSPTRTTESRLTPDGRQSGPMYSFLCLADQCEGSLQHCCVAMDILAAHSQSPLPMPQIGANATHNTAPISGCRQYAHDAHSPQAGAQSLCRGQLSWAAHARMHGAPPLPA